jgi:hypothetical protein
MTYLLAYARTLIPDLTSSWSEIEGKAIIIHDGEVVPAGTMLVGGCVAGGPAAATIKGKDINATYIMLPVPNTNNWSPAPFNIPTYITSKAKVKIQPKGRPAILVGLHTNEPPTLDERKLREIAIWLEEQDAQLLSAWGGGTVVKSLKMPQSLAAAIRALANRLRVHDSTLIRAAIQRLLEDIEKNMRGG